MRNFSTANRLQYMVYQSSSPAEAVADMAASNAKFFTILDVSYRKVYHQCPLDAQSQSLTTFITPFGRFKYLLAPYCISSISEHYDRRMAEAFAGLSGFRWIIDDIVMYDSDMLLNMPTMLEAFSKGAQTNRSCSI